MFDKIIKKLTLPTVVELGWSEDEALPLRKFSPEEIGYTWEDYHEKMSNEHPYLYFLNHDIPLFFKVKFIMPIRYKWYKILDKFSNDHLLDLRQPKSKFESCDHYEGGKLVIKEKILYAMFNSLCNFYDKDFENIYVPTDKDLEKSPSCKDYIDFKKEVDFLVKWWRVDRKKDYENCYGSGTKEFDVFQQKEEEMCIRLIKIMKYLDQYY